MRPHKIVQSRREEVGTGTGTGRSGHEHEADTTGAGRRAFLREAGEEADSRAHEKRQEETTARATDSVRGVWH